MITLLLTALLISFLLQLFFFCFAFFFKTDKVTDFTYGLTFIALAAYSFWNQPQPTTFHWLLLSLITIWALRLIIYLFIRINVIKRDARFDHIRTDFKKFLTFWLFQALAVWIIMLPSLVVFSKPLENSLPLLSLVGVLIWGISLSIETLADWQKFTFKLKPENKDTWTNVGLWQYARHPNYFGEMMCWWGIYLMVLPHLNGWEYLSVAGPLFITYILLFVSGVPPLEKKYNEKFKNNTEYQKYKNNTRLLIPVP